MSAAAKQVHPSYLGRDCLAHVAHPIDQARADRLAAAMSEELRLRAFALSLPDFCRLALRT